MIFHKKETEKIELVARPDHNLMQQPVFTETDSRLRRKLISIFYGSEINRSGH